MMLDAENDEFDQEALKDLEGVEVKQSDKAKGIKLHQSLGIFIVCCKFFLSVNDTGNNDNSR